MSTGSRLTCLLLWLLPLVAAGDPSPAADPSATPLLDLTPPATQTAAGLDELTATERLNLEAYLAYEIAAARAGNVAGFARSFTTRRTSEELAATGLDRLSPAQRAAWDTHVAVRLAERPSLAYPLRRNRPRPADGDAPAIDHVARPPWRVHGSVTATVGSSSAGTFYGGSMTTAITGPDGRFTAQITYGTLRGNLPYYDPYPYRRYPYVIAPLP
jgi:hypothetical protein